MSGFLSLPDTGARYEALGIPVRIRAGGGDTGGALDVVEVEFPPGIPFPAHRHHNSDEAFYVLEGEIMATIGDSVTRVGVGTFAFAPRGIVHGFANESTAPARVLAWQSPSPDMVGFLKALTELTRDGEPDMEQIMSVLQRFDVEPVG